MKVNEEVKRLVDKTKSKKGPKKQRKAEKAALSKCAVKLAAEIAACNTLLTSSTSIPDSQRNTYSTIGSCFQTAVEKNWLCQDKKNNIKSVYFREKAEK